MTIKVSEFQVDRQDLSVARWVERDQSSGLAGGEALLKIDRFSMTANNITYAALGETMRYWDFFPAEPGRGIIPVWGFADVVASACDGVDVGERFYGYFPMATHLKVAAKVTGHGFIDVAEHRKHLSIIYNQYINTRTDLLYRAQAEALQMLLRPLFTTSFLLNDFFQEQQFFGAQKLLLTSASSKTAIGMAHLLQLQKNEHHPVQVIGLTSAANKAIVASLGCYDAVMTYDELDQLNNAASAIVDFAGNGQLLAQLYARLNERLRYVCLVGAAHWEDRQGLPKNVNGPKPLMFFAPTQAEKRLGEWGAADFNRRLATAWASFSDFTERWLTIESHAGATSIAAIYQQLLAGKTHPAVGTVMSFNAQ